MAASGLVNIAEAAAIEMSMKHKIPRVQLVKLKGIFHGNFETSSQTNGPDIAKCLEKLNGVLPKQSIEPYLKTSLANFTGLFAKESFSNRLERSPSTDSIAVSNFSSDQGSVDSCHYSSTGSDSNSGSSPSSPEESDRCSSAGSPQSMPPTSPPLYEFQGEEPLDESCSTQSEDKSSRTEFECRTVDQSEAKLRTEIECRSDDQFEDKSSRVEVMCRTDDQSTDRSSRVEVECRTDDDTVQSSRTAFEYHNRSEEKSARLEGKHKLDDDCGERPSKRLHADSSEDNSKLFYLRQQQKDCNVPNNNSISETFQSHGPPSYSCVPSTVVVQNGQRLDSVKASCKVSASKSKVDLSSSSSSNGTNQSSCSSADMQQCNWVNCGICLEGNTELVEHIRTQHVQVQKDKESFVCLWAGCKVYDRSSCSLSWLERHILCHGGNKPFKCIVDNCSQRFPTQAALQRHVNSHFDRHPNSHGGKVGRCKEESNAKSLRKKRNAKFKNRSVLGKTEDFFDANVMEQIRYRLVEVHSSHPLNCTSHSGSITFQSKVRGVRTDKSGKIQVLLHWIPENILPDSWVPEQEVTRSKTVPYSALPPESLHTPLDDAPRVKQRRK